MEFTAAKIPHHGFGDLTNISSAKLEDLEAAVGAILALPLARDTYAQIIEGRPTRTPYSDKIKGTKSTFYKTIIVSNDKPSDEAVQEYDKIRTAFALRHLVIDLKLAQKYQNAQRGSRDYRLRLLEMAAASVHALAGMLYASSHLDMDVKPPEPKGGWHNLFHATDGFYVDFYHVKYRRFQRYPFGLLNVVGYWAETQIFGGVLVFEHEEDGSGIINAFLHPQMSMQAFMLSDAQLQLFADLGGAGSAAAHHPTGPVGAESFVPFAREPAARTEPTFATLGEGPLRIYKNEYDQRPVMFPPRRSCVNRPEDGMVVKIDEALAIAKAKGWLDTPRPDTARGDAETRSEGGAPSADKQRQ